MQRDDSWGGSTDPEEDEAKKEVNRSKETIKPSFEDLQKKTFP